MILDEQYLAERHEMWRNLIDEAGIWDACRFLPVEFSIRRKSKTRHGAFMRKQSTGFFKTTLSDRIFIYRNLDMMPEKHLDNILVHEMIHQYIVQNGLKDTSPHGRLFKSFMSRINAAFPTVLSLAVSLKSRPATGKGDKISVLLLAETVIGTVYCCRIVPHRAVRLVSAVHSRDYRPAIARCTLCQSDDLYFQTLPACRTRLHGLKKTKPEMKAFLAEHRVTPLDSGLFPNLISLTDVYSQDKY